MTPEGWEFLPKSTRMVVVPAEGHQNRGCFCRKTPEWWVFLQEDTRRVGVPAEKYHDGGCSCRRTPESSVFLQKETITWVFFHMRISKPCTSRIQARRVTDCTTVLGADVVGDIIKNIYFI
jgi:hypothetical protein